MSTSDPNNKITRRDLLKFMAAGVGSGLANAAAAPARGAARAASWLEAASADPQVEFAGMLVRGTVDGCILASKDGGKTWTRATCLHPGCAVTSLTVSRGTLSARLDFQGHAFSLASADGKVWKSG